jgi:hypothetical protein
MVVSTRSTVPPPFDDPLPPPPPLEQQMTYLTIEAHEMNIQLNQRILAQESQTHQMLESFLADFNNRTNMPPSNFPPSQPFSPPAPFPSSSFHNKSQHHLLLAAIIMLTVNMTIKDFILIIIMTMIFITTLTQLHFMIVLDRRRVGILMTLVPNDIHHVLSCQNLMVLMSWIGWRTANSPLKSPTLLDITKFKQLFPISLARHVNGISIINYSISILIGPTLKKRSWIGLVKIL